MNCLRKGSDYAKKKHIMHLYLLWRIDKFSEIDVRARSIFPNLNFEHASAFRIKYPYPNQWLESHSWNNMSSTRECVASAIKSLLYLNCLKSSKSNWKIKKSVRHRDSCRCCENEIRTEVGVNPYCWMSAIKPQLSVLVFPKQCIKYTRCLPATRGVVA